MKRYLLPLALVLSACNASDKTETPESPSPDLRPNVILETALGNIEIEVYQDSAPISGTDFLAHVDQGLYDGEGFYRTVYAENDPLGMGMSLIQGGVLDYESGLPQIEHEKTTDTGLSNTRGVISIARGEPGTGSAAYFFINIGNNAFLDYGGERNPDGEGYATFGRVVSGMDVVETIQSQPVSQESDNDVTKGQILAEPVTIIKAYRVE